MGFILRRDLWTTSWSLKVVRGTWSIQSFCALLFNTMASERRPLLTEEYSDGESFDSSTVPILHNRAWSLRFLKKGMFHCFLNLHPHLLLLGQFFPFSIGLWIVLFGLYSTVDYFTVSMRRLEASECSDVMADCEDVPFNETLVPPYYDYLQDFTVSPSNFIILKPGCSDSPSLRHFAVLNPKSYVDNWYCHFMLSRQSRGILESKPDYCKRML